MINSFVFERGAEGGLPEDVARDLDDNYDEGKNQLVSNVRFEVAEGSIKFSYDHRLSGIDHNLERNVIESALEKGYSIDNLSIRRTNNKS